MPGTLKEFLIDLAEDPEKLESFNSSTESAQTLMQQASLPSNVQQILLSHDASAIYDQLLAEDAAGEYIIPFGPIMPGEPPFFRQMFAGIMVFGTARKKPAGRGVTRPTPMRPKKKKAASKANAKRSAKGKAKAKSRGRK